MVDRMLEADGVVPVLGTFAYQSYFDSTLLEKALLIQNPGEQIVASTMLDDQNSGFGFALAPWSKTPIAIIPNYQGRPSGAGCLFLSPGQQIRTKNPFVGFRWGLPYGWLGGGDACLFVLQGRESFVDFGEGGREVLFHRCRKQILGVLVNPITGLLPNWPTMFPAKNSIRRAAAVDYAQAGRPNLTVTPTRTVLRLRVAPLDDPGNVRALVYGSEAFDTDSAGAFAGSQSSIVDLVFPSAPTLGAVFTTQFPVISLNNGILVDLGTEDASSGGVTFIDGTGVATLTGTYIDVLRYG